jgi:hypothetical protein
MNPEAPPEESANECNNDCTPPALASDEALRIARTDAERVYRELDLY